MKNHLGENVYQTYSGWRAACKKVNPAVKFEGDKDICTALGVGEWGGDEGSVFNRPVIIETPAAKPRTYNIFISENQLVIIRAALEAKRAVPKSDIEEGKELAEKIGDILDSKDGLTDCCINNLHEGGYSQSMKKKCEEQMLQDFYDYLEAAANVEDNMNASTNKERLADFYSFMHQKMNGVK